MKKEKQELLEDQERVDQENSILEEAEKEQEDKLMYQL